jgi:predicted Zn-dependent protease with MMP-like domain
VLDIGPEEFERLVAQALDDIPDELARLVDNVVFLVEDDSGSAPGSPRLLGLYEGIPLTERGQWYAGALPDRITIYRIPILSICQSEADVVAEVRITVVHEIAHHFGIDDDRLHELGYG